MRQPGGSDIRPHGHHAEDDPDARGRGVVAGLGHERVTGVDRPVNDAVAEEDEDKKADGAPFAQGVQGFLCIGSPVHSLFRPPERHVEAEEGRGQGQREHREGRAPRPLPEHAAEDGVDDGPEAVDRGQPSHDARQMRLVVHVRGKDGVEYAERPRPQSLHDPVEQHLLPRVGEEAEHAPEGKDQQRGQEHGLSAEAVGKHPGHGRHRGFGQREADHHHARCGGAQAEGMHHGGQDRQDQGHAHGTQQTDAEKQRQIFLSRHGSPPSGSPHGTTPGFGNLVFFRPPESAAPGLRPTESGNRLHRCALRTGRGGKGRPRARAVARRVRQQGHDCSLQEKTRSAARRVPWTVSMTCLVMLLTAARRVWPWTFPGFPPERGPYSSGISIPSVTRPGFSASRKARASSAPEPEAYRPSPAGIAPPGRRTPPSAPEPPQPRLKGSLKRLFGKGRIVQRKPDAAGHVPTVAAVLHPFLLGAGVEGADVFPHKRRPVDLPLFRRATPAFAPERRALRTIHTARVHASSFCRLSFRAAERGLSSPITGRGGGHP